MRASQLFLIAISFGCTGPDEILELGMIQMPGSLDDNLVAPDTVRAGEVFAATLWTYRGGCEREGPTRIQQLSSDRTRITPYETVPVGEDIVCPDFLGRFPRSVELSFGIPGAATIAARGRTDVRHQTVTIEESVVVLP
jgi:hypothetical protein